MLRGTIASLAHRSLRRGGAEALLRDASLHARPVTAIHRPTKLRVMTAKAAAMSERTWAAISAHAVTRAWLITARAWLITAGMFRARTLVVVLARLLLRLRAASSLIPLGLRAVAAMCLRSAGAMIATRAITRALLIATRA